MLEVMSPEIRPIRRVEYEKMAEVGLFDGERVELLYGSIVRMSPIGPPHSSTVQKLNRLLLRALDEKAAIRIQSPFAASDESEPEPDLAVVPPGEYADAHPQQAWLTIEVADSSRKKDRLKATLYAESGVTEYWIVDLVANLIEVHTEIVAGEYARVVPYRKGERISLACFPDVSIAVDDVLR
jgi:Uma2 family endonuclease